MNVSRHPGKDGDANQGRRDGEYWALRRSGHVIHLCSLPSSRRSCRGVNGLVQMTDGLRVRGEMLRLPEGRRQIQREFALSTRSNLSQALMGASSRLCRSGNHRVANRVASRGCATIDMPQRPVAVFVRGVRFCALWLGGTAFNPMNHLPCHGFGQDPLRVSSAPFQGDARPVGYPPRGRWPA